MQKVSVSAVFLSKKYVIFYKYRKAFDAAVARRLNVDYFSTERRRKGRLNGRVCLHLLEISL
jgi:hypothetical protein